MPDSGARVRVIEYNIEDFLSSCMERYKELTGVTTLRRATTPFLQVSDPDLSDLLAASRTVDSAAGELCNVLRRSKDDGDTVRTKLPQQHKPYAARS